MAPEEYVPLPEAWTRSATDSMALVSVAPACGVTHVADDFDGDSARDVAVVYARPRAGDPCDDDTTLGRYRVAVQLGSGARVERWMALGVPVDELKGRGPCYPDCAAFAAPDLDADGRAELALALGNGASQVMVGMYRVTASRIRRLAYAGGVPLVFTFFGGMTQGGWVVCRTGRHGEPLVVQGTYGVDDWAGYLGETVYGFDGRTFRHRTTRERVMPASAWPGPGSLAGRRCVVPIPGA